MRPVLSSNLSRKAARSDGSRLIGLLSPKDYERLRPHLERIALAGGQVLYSAHTPIKYVYFIETGVCAVMDTLADGVAGKVGTVGNEGMVGLPVVWGEHRAPHSVFVQIPGVGLRMKAALFRKELARSASLHAVMLRYASAFFNRVARSAVCNHFHSIRQRCCRLLLMTQDHMRSDQFLLTHKSLATMLGTHRPGVTATAITLQRAGLIRYSRGNVTILDRAGLQRCSCECYSATKREFDRLLGAPARRETRVPFTQDDLTLRSTAPRLRSAQAARVSKGGRSLGLAAPSKRARRLPRAIRGAPSSA